MKKSLFVFGAILFAVLRAGAQYYPGNLAVLRVGNTNEILANNGNTVFIDQYTTSGLRTNFVMVPNIGTNTMILSGVAGSEGGLTRSVDRSVLLFSAYHVGRGFAVAALSSYSGTAIERGYCSIDATGVVSLLQLSPTLYSGSNPRCMAGTKATNVWAAGGILGTMYLNPGYPATPYLVQTNLDNTRYIKIVASNLWFSVQAGNAPGIYTLGTVGNPRKPVGLVTNLVTTNLVIATGVNSQPSAFDVDPALTTAYVADMRAQAAGGGVQKWTNNAGIWKLAYTFGIGNTNFGVFGVAVDFSGSNAVVYATTTEGTTSGNAQTNRLIRIVDTNSTAQVKTLATAGSNQAFRGLDFVPDLRPSILNPPPSETVTNGGSFTLTVSIASLFPVTYQWQFDGTNIFHATNSIYSSTNVQSSAQGNYSVVVSDKYGSITSAVAQLTVNATLTGPSITNQPMDVAIYQGGPADFSVSADGTPPLDYQWEFNGALIPGATNSSYFIASVDPTNSGDYVVVVSNGGGSTNSLPAVLSVSPWPASSFVAYGVAGSDYYQDFNSLPGAGEASVNATNPVTIGGSTYTLANPVDLAFPILPIPSGLGLSNTMSGWYGSGALAIKLGASDGDQTTGGIVSFGSTNSASTNRALGLLATSTSGATEFAVRFVNLSGGILGSFNLAFTGELWRQQTNAKSAGVYYWIDPSGTNTLSTNTTSVLTNLMVAFPTGTPGPVDGTSAQNQILKQAMVTPTGGWPAGAALWIVWTMNDASGSGQGLGIDDFHFSAAATGESCQALTIQPAGAEVTISWCSGATLQQNSDLSVTNGWTPVTTPFTTTNGLNWITLPAISAGQYFRSVQ